MVSPWRAAKPRKPLRDIAGEPESPKTLGVNNESPPNSSHKESTRLESGLRGEGGLDLSQVHDDNVNELVVTVGVSIIGPKPLPPRGLLQLFQSLLRPRHRPGPSPS